MNCLFKVGTPQDPKKIHSVAMMILYFFRYTMGLFNKIFFNYALQICKKYKMFMFFLRFFCYNWSVPASIGHGVETLKTQGMGREKEQRTFVAQCGG
jgi:hypothetical protein